MIKIYNSITTDNVYRAHSVDTLAKRIAGVNGWAKLQHTDARGRTSWVYDIVDGAGNIRATVASFEPEELTEEDMTEFENDAMVNGWTHACSHEGSMYV